MQTENCYALVDSNNKVYLHTVDHGKRYPRQELIKLFNHMIKDDRGLPRKERKFPRGTPEFKAWNKQDRAAIYRICLRYGFRIKKVNVMLEVDDD